MGRSVRGSTKAWQNLRRKKLHKQEKARPDKGMKAYADRQLLLINLGFKDYAEYLTSELWARIRSAKLTPHKVCVLCDCKSEQVHHLSYDEETLMGRRMSNLVQLCRTCHLQIEFTPTGEKRAMREVNKMLKKRASQTTKGLSWLRYLEVVRRNLEARQKRKKEKGNK